MGKFHGYPSDVISSRHLRIEFLTQAGPRLVGLYPVGDKKNLLAELVEPTWDTPYGDYKMYGGHRLWHSPEAMPRSYLPDNDGLIIENTPGGVCLIQPEEPGSHLLKSMELTLYEDRPAVTIMHTLENKGLWEVELAPWAITQLALGGVAVLPTGAPPDASPYTPNRQVALWSYSSWDDDRLHINDLFWFVDGKSRDRAFKVGYSNTAGWIGYRVDDLFFHKHFDPQLDRPHSDSQCNAECYVYNRFIELETLGPLVRLAPGQKLTHREVWFIEKGVHEPVTGEGMQALADRLELPVYQA
jgi:hypothetical protein